jgi:hypothetical protein
MNPASLPSATQPGESQPAPARIALADDGASSPEAASAAAPAQSQPDAPHLLCDRAYGLRLDRIRLETVALMRHCLARTAAGEGDAYEAARCECEAASLELAAACLREAEGDGTEPGAGEPFAARNHLQTLAADARGMALHHTGNNGANLPDFPGVAANLHAAAAYRLALAVLAEPHALDNPDQLRLPLAA